jgi:predicted MPP superfamily phosphohydrolase
LKNYKLDTNKKWFYMFDLHLPFHYDCKIKAALQWAKKERLKHIVLGGDIFDFIGVSSFSRNDRQSLYAEIKKGIPAFNKYISQFDEVVYIMGNHERRLRRYICKYAQELMEFLPDTVACVKYVLELCGLQHNNLTFVDCLTNKNKFNPVKFGKLNIFHGDEFRIAGILNPCRKVFNIIHDHALFGHIHTPESILRMSADGSTFAVVCAGTAQDESFMSFTQWAFTVGYVESAGCGGRFRIIEKKVVGKELY